jgi:CRP-like cAMP-binding protein
MPKRKLTNHLGSMHPVSKGLASLLENDTTLKKQNLKKNATLLMPKMLVDEAHYIYKGLCKAYWLNEDNEEEIFFFWADNSIVILPEEFFAEKKNDTVYIVIVEDTELYTITKAQMDEIYLKYAEALILTNIIRKEMIAQRNKQLSILMKKPGVRYGLFLNEFQYLYKKGLADKDVMGFLGICQKTLTSSKREMVLRDRRKRR